MRCPDKAGSGARSAHRGARPSRRLWAASAVCALAVLAACGGGSGRAVGSSSTVGGSSPTTTVAVSSATTTTTTRTASGRTTTCAAAGLTATASPGSGAGGHESVVVVFTDTLSDACTMEGYPTAWLVDSAGAKIGPTSVDEVTQPPAPVSLEPGGRATTTFWYDNPQVRSPPCPTTAAAGISVTPPGQSRSLAVPFAVTVCRTGDVVGTTPVTSGTAESMF